jgi:hypothetical protein
MTLFYHPVFFSAVAHGRNFNDRGIYYLPLLCSKTILSKIGIELIKEGFYQVRLAEIFAKKPDGLGVGYTVIEGQIQKTHEG